MKSFCMLKTVISEEVFLYVWNEVFLYVWKYETVLENVISETLRKCESNVWKYNRINSV
jgi:hypothetical protein